MNKTGYKKHKRNIEGYLSEYTTKGSTWRAMEAAEKEFPAMAEKYFDINAKELLQI